MSDDPKVRVATAVWRLMSDFAMSEFRHKSRSLQELGLTPGHMKALMTLEPGEARPMGACAQEMGCDASTATWLIDRLEQKGLVERRPSVTDRRVKAVVLTALGRDTRLRLNEHFYEPPPALLELNKQELEQILGLLTALSNSEPLDRAQATSNQDSRQ